MRNPVFEAPSLSGATLPGIDLHQNSPARCILESVGHLPGDWPAMKAAIQHILIATDGSDLSNRAATYGVRLAKSLGAKLSAIHVIPQFHAFTYRSQMLLTYHAALPVDSEQAYVAATAEEAEGILGVIRKAAAKASVKCDASYVRHDQPYQAILDAAKKKGCDLIVMASHGRSGVAGVLLGSEAQKVLVHSDRPVLIWRG